MAPRKLQKAVTARLRLSGDVRIEHLDRDEEVVETVALSDDTSRLLVALATVKRPRPASDLIAKITEAGSSEDSEYDTAHRKRLQNAASAARKALGPARDNLPPAGRRGRYELKRDEKLVIDLDEANGLQRDGELLDALDLHCSGPVAANLDDRWLEGSRGEQRAAIKEMLEALHRDHNGPGDADLDGLVEQVLDGQSLRPVVNQWDMGQAPEGSTWESPDGVDLPASSKHNKEPKHYPEDDDKLDDPLLQRPSVQAFLKEIANSDALTIFVGAGASADIGIPLHEELMPAVLVNIASDKLNELSKVSPEAAEDRINAALKLLGKVSPVYLASIAREIASEGASGADNDLRHALERATRDSARHPGGFLARGVAALAFAMCSAGKRVTVITTNYDSTMTNEAEHKLHEHNTELKQYRFEPIKWPSWEEAHSKGEARRQLFDKAYDRANENSERVPLYYANGKLEGDQRIVAAELDFFRPAEGSDHERHEVRMGHLSTALKETTCIFVGSSVTDPDMLGRIAEASQVSQRHYAILLAPDMEVPEASSAMDAREALERSEAVHKLARKFVARRFRHLGVTPVTIDFPSQAPQILREIALQVQLGDEYESYGDRLAQWWKAWHKYLGFPSFTDGEPDRQRSVLMQAVWRDFLEELRDKVIRDFFEEHARGAQREELKIELWLRNIRERKLKYPPIEEGVRSLFLWANSESLWLDGKAALWGPVSIKTHDHYLAQEVFREGRTLAHRLDTPRGHWKYGVGMPLVLHKASWHHLPIGVVNIFSDTEPPPEDNKTLSSSSGRSSQSQLYAVADVESEQSKHDCGKVLTEDDGSTRRVRYTVAEKFEDIVKEPLNSLLGAEAPLFKLADRAGRIQQELNIDPREVLENLASEDELRQWRKDVD